MNYIAKIGAVSGVNYYMYNAHGDVVQVLDGSGTVKNRYEYDPFGETVLNVEETPNEIKYAGEFQDSSTGLYYLRARYYDPGSGRFMNEDTYRGNAANPASLNLYTYCYNDPVNFTDPSGHSPKEDFEKEYEKEHGTMKGASDRNYYNARTGAYQSPYADATSYQAKYSSHASYSALSGNSGSKANSDYEELSLQEWEKQHGTRKGFYDPWYNSETGKEEKSPYETIFPYGQYYDSNNPYLMICIAPDGSQRYLEQEDLYTAEFFKQLILDTNGNINLVLFVRDLNFNPNGANTIDQIKANAPELASKYIELMTKIAGNIVEGARLAALERTEADMPNVNIPGIIIGTPHFGPYMAESDKALMTDEQWEQSFMQLYDETVEAIYNGVSRVAPVRGIYFGREDPDRMLRGQDKTPEQRKSGDAIYWESSGEGIYYSTTFKMMRNSSEFAKDRGLTHVWKPYAMDDNEMLNIGEIVNKGVYRDQDNNLQSLFDVVIVQGGLFYAEVNGAFYGENIPKEISEQKTKDFFNRKLDDLFDSVKSQIFTIGKQVVGGNAGGGKRTNTAIGVQFEFDMSALTGRDHEHSDRYALPQQKAERLLTTLRRFEPLYGPNSTSKRPFGIYAGGPNELGYDVPPGGTNTNKHGSANYLVPNQPESGNGMTYAEILSSLGIQYTGSLQRQLIGMLTNNWEDWEEIMKEYFEAVGAEWK